MLAAAVGELAAGTMLLGLWILNDLWQLGVAGAVEIVLGIWAGYAALAAPADA